MKLTYAPLLANGAEARKKSRAHAMHRSSSRAFSQRPCTFITNVASRLAYAVDSGAGREVAPPNAPKKISQWGDGSVLIDAITVSKSASFSAVKLWDFQ